MANNLFTPLCRMFDLSVVIAISRNVFDHATSRSKMSNCLPYMVWFAATSLVKAGKAVENEDWLIRAYAILACITDARSY